MKKFWITIVIVILVLAIALCVIIFAGKNSIQGSADSLYKYSYQENSNGYRLTIKGEFPEGTSWTAFAKGGVLDCTVKKQNKNKAVVDIKAVEQGDSIIFLSFEDHNTDVPDRQYEIIIEASVGYQNAVSLRTFTHIVPKPLTKGSMNGFDYQVGELVDGRLMAVISSEKPDSWSVKEGSSQLLVEKSVDAEKGKTTFIFDHGEYLENEIYIISDAYDTSVKVAVYVDAIDRLRISSCVPADYINDTYVRVEDDYFMLIGKTKLPKEAQTLSSSTMYWTSKADGITGFYVGVLKFMLYDEEWTLYATDTANINDLSADLAAEDPKPEELKAGKLKAKLFKNTAPMAAVWESAGGYRYLLVGGNEEVFEDAVSAVMGTVK